jgi:branched-subunit amino acid ABC-type transport system permease component
MTELIVQAILLGSVYSLVAMAFNLIFAGSRVVNFAQGDLVASSGVVFAVLSVTRGLPFGLAVVIACLIVSAVALVIVLVLVLPTLPGVLDRAVNEQSQLRWVLTTLGASVVISAIGSIITPSGAIAVQPFISGSFGFLGADVPFYDVFVIAVTAVVVAASSIALAKTQWGRRLRAVASDRYGAEVIGIPSRRFIAVIFVIAGIFSAIAGILIAPVTQANATTGFTLGLAGFAAATVGGLGDLRGSAIGGMVIGFAELFGTRYVNSQLETVYPLLVLIVVLMVRPRGILQSSFVERV